MSDVLPGGKATTNLLADDGFNRLVRGRYGYILYNKNDTYVGQSIENYGEYSEGEAEVFRQLCKPGDIVIDVGANIGVHTLVFALAVGPAGRVLAFEPQGVVFQTLCANMALNSITHVECHRVAVGAVAGWTRIPDLNYAHTANFGSFTIDAYPVGVKTPVVTLDEFVDVPRLKLIKIDVEGMESAVLDGAAKTVEKHRPVLYIENDRKDQSPGLIDRVFRMGYAAFWHTPMLYNPKNFAHNPVNLFSTVVSGNMLCVPRARESSINGFVEIKTPHDYPPGINW